MLNFTKADNIPELLSFFTGNEPLPDDLALKCTSHRQFIIDRIATLQNQIQPILEELRGLQPEKAKFDTLLSPMRRLPNEIVSHLLRHCLGRIVDRKGRIHFANLRSVCKQWRNVAFATPELWRGVGFDIWDEYGTFGPVTSWCDRAGEMAPLALRVTQSCQGYGTEFRAQDAFFAFFRYFANAPRVTDLELFSITATDCDDDGGRLMEMPNIERLTIASSIERPIISSRTYTDSIWAWSGSLPLLVRPPLWKNLPRLRSLHLSGLESNHPYEKLRHPHLTSLHIIHSPTLGTTQNFVQFICDGLPALKMLTLEHVDTDTDNDNDNHSNMANLSAERSQHTGLQTLVVRGRDTMMSISSISFPSLQHFRILLSEALTGSNSPSASREDQDNGRIERETISRLTENQTLHTLSLEEGSVDLATNGTDCLARTMYIRRLEVPNCTFFGHIDVATLLAGKGLSNLETVVCKSPCTRDDVVRVHSSIVAWKTSSQVRPDEPMGRLCIYQRLVDEGVDMNLESYEQALGALQTVGVDMINEWEHIPGQEFPEHDCPFDIMEVSAQVRR